MWQVYRHRFLRYQLLILVMCGVSWLWLETPPERLWKLFLAMQLASLTGAWFGSRMLKQSKPPEADGSPTMRIHRDG